jgi:UDPglucose 6-dehydrogenase
VFRKIHDYFGGKLAGKTIALWGLAFKPNTDDLREAPSRVVVDDLLARGATVCAYDPVAMPEARRILGDRAGVRFADDPMGALEGADALLIVTEWKEFRSPDFEAIRGALRHPVIVDGRNMFPPALPRAAGLEYLAIGRP